MALSIRDVTPPKFLLVVCEIGTMDGMRDSTFPFKRFFPSKKRKNRKRLVSCLQIIFFFFQLLVKLALEPFPFSFIIFLVDSRLSFVGIIITFVSRCTRFFGITIVFIFFILESGFKSILNLGLDFCYLCRYFMHSYLAKRFRFV